MRALVVAGVVVAVAALMYVARSADRGATQSASYRHYFAIGKHACEAPNATPIDDTTVWSGFWQASITVKRTVPDEERRALIAGCAAAAG
jgi:hypothetical protein